MEKQRLMRNLKLTRFQIWKQVILLVLVAVIMLMLYIGYSGIRKSSIDHYSDTQMLYASQIASEVQFRFGIIQKVLELWSGSPSIQTFSRDGIEAMEHILQVHYPEISAVTRMDENGIIIHSVPYVEGTIGTDISSQAHIRRLMETLEPVFGDAFLAVQGYWSLAYHVPVFDKAGGFRGSLAVLIPFRDMIDRIFSQTVHQEGQNVWMLGGDGTVLYSRFEEEEGLHYSELGRGAGFDSIGAAAISGTLGYMTVEFIPDPIDGSGVTSTFLTTIYPFSVGGTTWSLVLSIPRGVVLRDISLLRNSFLLGAAGILVLTLLYSTLKLRAWISASQARKWEEIARIHQLLKLTIDRTSELVAILDEDLRILYANPSAERITGFGMDMLGRPLHELNVGALKPSVPLIADQIAKSGNWIGNIEGTGQGGKQFRLHLSVSWVTRSGESGNYYILIGTDILVQSEMERRLHEKQKMEAIGQLAGGIAHDFNNLLVGIQGYAELLEMRYTDDPEIVRPVKVIQDAVQRGSELTKQLLGYARKGKHKIESVDLAQSVMNVWNLIKRTIDRRIEVQLDLDPGIIVQGDPAQLEQVVLNLAVNARDAMPEGGILRFELHTSQVPGALLGEGAGSEPMTLAVLKTADTGVGIDPEDVDRIFEPFFTTKLSEGTGMGLATVFGIVTNHGGWIDVDSTPGRGTCFTIFLPISGFMSDEHTNSQTMTPAGPTGRGRVLLVDDEPVVLSTTSELLGEIGYDVLEASSGAAALDILQEQGDEVKAVILDLSMPRMDGGQCFHAIRKMYPGMTVVLASGYSIDGRVQELLDQGANAFLQKPFRLSVLAEILAGLIPDPG